MTAVFHKLLIFSLRHTLTRFHYETFLQVINATCDVMYAVLGSNGGLLVILSWTSAAPIVLILRHDLRAP